jgi:Fe2+ or Zn2+ uptake regulation protein
MTKGQNKTVEFIEQFVESNDLKFTWQELVNEIEASGATVKNWLTIRRVLQWFINEGLIQRNRSDLRIEEYVKA